MSTLSSVHLSNLFSLLHLSPSLLLIAFAVGSALVIPKRRSSVFAAFFCHYFFIFCVFLHHSTLPGLHHFYVWRWRQHSCGPWPRGREAHERCSRSCQRMKSQLCREAWGCLYWDVSSSVFVSFATAWSGRELARCRTNPETQSFLYELTAD